MSLEARKAQLVGDLMKTVAQLAALTAVEMAEIVAAMRREMGDEHGAHVLDDFAKIMRKDKLPPQAN